MSTTTITALTLVLAGNLTDAAVFPVDDANGNTRKATIAQLRTQINTGAQVFTAGLSGITTLSMSGALTYGGVTLTAAVTGTAKMVLSNAPTFDAGAVFAGALTGITSLAVTAAAKTIDFSGASSGSVSDGSTFDQTMQQGAVLIFSSSGQSALVLVSTSNTKVVSQASTEFTTTLDNATTTNVAYHSGTLSIQNKTGSSKTYKVITFFGG